MEEVDRCHNQSAQPHQLSFPSPFPLLHSADAGMATASDRSRHFSGRPRSANRFLSSSDVMNGLSASDGDRQLEANSHLPRERASSVAIERVELGGELTQQQAEAEGKQKLSAMTLKKPAPLILTFHTPAQSITDRSAGTIHQPPTHSPSARLSGSWGWGGSAVR